MTKELGLFSDREWIAPPIKRDPQRFRHLRTPANKDSR